MSLLYCDCFSGISGDMFLGALLDAGMPVEYLSERLRQLGLLEFRGVTAEKVRKGALAATRMKLELFQPCPEPDRHAGHHRHWGDIQHLIEASDLSEGIRQNSLRIFQILAEAEAQVHGTPVDQVHFHEVGATDSILDIVGAAIGLEYFEVEAVFSSPLPLGNGQVHTQHGRLPLPAPATLALICRAQVPVCPSDATVELVTPTGAAILAALAEFRQPEMTVKQTGAGAGQRDLAWPNILRVVIGAPAKNPALPGEASQGQARIEMQSPARNAVAPETPPDQATKTLLEQHFRLKELTRGYRPAQILFTCLELGVFATLAGQHATAQEIAGSTGTDSRAMDLLLNAAAALGLLEKRDSLFTIMPWLETCLTPGRPGDITGSLRLESAFYHRWGRLAEAVRTGKRPEENRQDEQPVDWVRRFIYALYQRALPVAPAVAEALALPEDRPVRVIDVGGGHGGYCLALAQRYPLLTATVFELPRVVPVAREIIENASLAERVRVQEGDFQKEELGAGYDVALVFGVLNGEPPEGRPALIRKVFAALNPGGLIVLRDFVLNPDRAGPPDAAIFALQMLLATESGGLDTSADWETWLLSAGFAPAKRLALPEWVGSYLTISVKPAA